MQNKYRFDRRHRLRPRKIEDGDWVIVYDSSLEHQHSTVRKFARRWFGPYEVRQSRDNGTYQLSELNGMMLRTPIAGKRIKIFKKREEAYPRMDSDESSLHREDGPEDNEGVELVVELTEDTGYGDD